MNYNEPVLLIDIDSEDNKNIFKLTQEGEDILMSV